MDTAKYAIYLSHSWLADHVALNIAVWEHLWEHAVLYVDDNRELNPPFYVNRIEHLIRASDAFLAIVPAPSPESISPYMHFEIDLARRASLPSLVLHDVHLDPVLPQVVPESIRLVAFDTRRVDDLPADVVAQISSWLCTVVDSGPPRIRRESISAVLLFPHTPEVSDITCVLTDTLHASGYQDVWSISADTSDVDALASFRAADLLVVDIGVPSLWDIYGMAHALALPTIRLFHGPSPVDASRLPGILRGGHIGYKDDIVTWSSLQELANAVERRSNLWRQRTTVIDKREEGIARFGRQRRRADIS